MNATLFDLMAKSYGLYLNSIALLYPKIAAKKAFQAYSSPRKGEIQSHQFSFLDSAKDGTIEVDGISLQVYRWTGPKETVLLVHGWESNTYRWKELIFALQKEGYNIIAFDAPAHGNSSSKSWNVSLYAKCVFQLTEHYNPQTVIGHSFGGMAAILMQIWHPNQYISSIVSISAPSETTQLMGYFKNLLGLNTKVMYSLNSLYKERFGYSIKELSTVLLAKDLEIPGFLIHDIEDPITPFEASKKINNTWKKSTLVSTSGYGHSMRTKEVNVKIIDFLKSLK